MPRRLTQRAISASVILTALMLAAGLSACAKTETSASLRAEAKQYQAKGDDKAALIQLKNAASTSPADAEVRFDLAAMYIHLGDAVSAEKEIRKAISLGGDGARAAPVLAKALLMQGQMQKAIDASAAAGAKASPELLAIVGDAYLGLNDTVKAKQYYQQALAAKPGQIDGLLGMARLAMFDNDTVGASQLAEQAISANPKDPAAWFFKGTLMRALGKPDEAIAAYGQAIALKPDHVNALVERANINIAAKKFDAAKADVDTAKKVSPNSLLVLYTQGLLDFAQGRFAQANEPLQKVLRAAPEHMPTILLAGAIELNLGTMQQAEQHLRKYVEKYPDNAYARKLLAQAQLKGAQPVDAAATLAPLLKDGAQDAQLLALAGESSMQARDFQKASQYFAQAAVLQPKAASLHTALGLSKLGQGDQQGAVGELERATALDPQSERAGVALVRTELALKHFDKALAAAQALVAAHPDEAEMRNLVGGVYMSNGDRVAARTSFDKATSLKPTFFPAVMNLAQLDMADKQPEAAKKRLTAFLEKDKKSSEAMTALAKLALFQNHPEEATTWLEKASAENPAEVGPAAQLVTHYLHTGQPQKALTLVRKLQIANPANAELLDLLGQAQMATKDNAGALETYSKLVNVAPKSALAQYRLASAHILMNNEDAAASDLKKAVALQPGFLPAQLAQVSLAMRKNRSDEALAIARQIQTQAGQKATGLVLEGDVLQKQKKPAPALAAYEKAFALEKTSPLMITIHRLMVQTGKQKDADQRMAEWTSAHPADMLTAMYVAETNLAKNDLKTAIAQFVAILKHDPENATALNNLAWAYQQEKDPKALETAEHAYRVAGDAAPVMDTLAAILTERGDTKRSVPLLQKAVVVEPNDMAIRLHLAQALVKSGDKANARKELQQIVSKGNGLPQFAEAQTLLKQL